MTNKEDKTTGAGGAMLTVAIKDKESLYDVYMPFVKNGGLFIPTKRPYELHSQVFVVLSLMDEKAKIPFAGRVVWITPLGAQNNRQPGIGIQFSNDHSGKALRNKIETLLAGALKSERLTNTM